MPIPSIARQSLTSRLVFGTGALVLAMGGIWAVTSLAEQPPAGAPASQSQSSQDPAAKPAPTTKDDHPFPRHIRAPALDGGTGWINTAGPIELKQLRGKFVLLDFWTYCCINCMHILPELKKLEHAYPNEIVVIGVHSAKFETEQDANNIKEAVLRYEIEHPVVNDANHEIWNQYGVSSWPTLCVIDPEGNLIARNSGEIDFKTLDAFFKRALPYYRRNGLVDETPLRFELAAYSAPETPLRFPGKVLADEATDRLYIADSNHNRIVVTRLDGTLVDIIGSGEIGDDDGSYTKARFNHPQGMALDNDALYVADTENHLIRRVDLKRKRVRTIAGTGAQGHGWPGMEAFVDGLGARESKHRWLGPPRKTAINSPWALWVHNRDLYIAMAGPHQIWKMPLSRGGQIGPYAGNGREDIVDGPLLPDKPYDVGYSSFAQPSGLASDGTVLYVADSEGSSIRAVPFDPKGRVTTVVGTSYLPGGRLFAFGDVDGQGEEVRLQHALGVVFHDEVLYIADTYNNKIKMIDPRSATSQTLVGTRKPGAGDSPPQFDEPAGISYAAGKLFVADTNNHLIRTIDLDNENRVATLEIKGLEPPAPPKVDKKPSFPGAAKETVGPTSVRPTDGKIRVQVDLTLPEGYKINTAAPLRYLVETTTPEGPVSRESVGTLVDAPQRAAKFEFDLPITKNQGSDKLRISLAYYYCQEGAEGICKAGSVVWSVPVAISQDAADEIVKLEHAVE